MSAQRLRWLFLLPAFASLSACAWLVPQVEAPEECGFPVRTVLAFAEQSSVRRLGLEQVIGPRDIEGTFYVTKEPIRTTDGPGTRFYCIDTGGEFMSGGGVPDDWDPFAER
ncbi:MAG TPA: hypothetical protein VEW95_04695 [Candidatus Limnocylindrales bacterium]|nr:hypothetical protein [Candidatus Limnocylindrales bacterium]